MIIKEGKKIVVECENLYIDDSLLICSRLEDYECPFCPFVEEYEGKKARHLCPDIEDMRKDKYTIRYEANRAYYLSR
ncbi:MAG TPA: hypothetical protein VFD02_06340 [Syntrophomonadaceae bacterium]|nr:hypothetical protein [Syntrophomonadaceae bacterium]